MAIDFNSHRRAALVEDIKFLHAHGVVPVRWPERVGRSATAIEQTLRRSGENYLANLLTYHIKKRPRLRDQ